MTDIRIRVGSATQTVRPEFVTAVEKLGKDLGPNYSVTIQQVERIPGRYGVVWGESAAIFIATSAASGLIGAIVSDVYAKSKKWGRERFNNKRATNPNGRTRPLTITIYDAEDQRLLSWMINGDGEHETNYREQANGSSSGSKEA